MNRATLKSNVRLSRGRGANGIFHAHPSRSRCKDVRGFTLIELLIVITIVPIIIGDESEAVAAAAAFRKRGIFVPAIRYPTVARGKARLRVTLTAAHTAADISQLATALNEIVNRKS